MVGCPGPPEAGHWEVKDRWTGASERWTDGEAFETVCLSVFPAGRTGEGEETGGASFRPGKGLNLNPP